jgi:DNA invertase Pin-like site-specific DNA recombinase
MLEYVIAIYLRLSLDDKITDSMSIANQRQKLKRYIAEMPEFQNAKVIEFVDNGYSGTNFERPAVQELLEMVRQGKIHCIIVKDFSRFGRNAIEMGYFIEQVFPLFQTRFISADDSFDSNNFKGDTGGIDVAFKFITHETYSQDLSKKIKSAKHSKMKRGEYVNKNCLYGYQVDKSRKLVPDEAAAQNVRMIFDLLLSGKSPSEIRKILFEQKIPTPGEYKGLQGKVKGKQWLSEQPTYLWPSGTLIKLLRDEKYTGTYISGKTEILEVGTHKPIKQDESDWIKIPNHHPVIIEKFVFDEAQEKLKPFLRPNGHKGYKARNYPLKGKAYCGSCGHAMQRDPIANPIYRCRRTKANPNADCFNMTVREKDINTLLMTVIRKQLKVLLNLDEAAGLNGLDVKLAEQQEQHTQISHLEDEKRRLYEQLVETKISTVDYRSKKAELDGAISRLLQNQSVLVTQAAQIEDAAKRHETVMAVAEKVRYKHGLTQELADRLIEKVLIFPNNQVEILWKFEDFATPNRKGIENEVSKSSSYTLPNGTQRRYRHRNAETSTVTVRP